MERRIMTLPEFMEMETDDELPKEPELKGMGLRFPSSIRTPEDVFTVLLCTYCGDNYTRLTNVIQGQGGRIALQFACENCENYEFLVEFKPHKGETHITSLVVDLS